ncbi:MAG: hypothetical protein TE42_08245, partial [Candidatus Synechococcus spongiarum SP3]
DRLLWLSQRQMERIQSFFPKSRVVSRGEDRKNRHSYDKVNPICPQALVLQSRRSLYSDYDQQPVEQRCGNFAHLQAQGSSCGKGVMPLRRGGDSQETSAERGVAHWFWLRERQLENTPSFFFRERSVSPVDVPRH